jgi:fermentation-respiration switch protein FrsA (DUF1100 family)
MRKLLFLIPFIFCSCEYLVNSVSFFPDQKYFIPNEKLPSYISSVTIKTSDGLNIQGLYFHHAAKSRQIIVYFHGNAGNMYHRINEAQKLFEIGPDILLVSYRGYARSEGSPTEKGIYIDAESAIVWTTDSMHYNLKDVILYGRSIGTTAAVNAAQGKSIGKLILITPLASGRHMAEQLGLGSFTSFIGNPFDSLSKINRIQCPLLIIHGTGDEVISYKQGKKLFDEFKGSKKFVTIVNGKHNDLEFADDALFWNSLRLFISSQSPLPSLSYGDALTR